MYVLYGCCCHWRCEAGSKATNVGMTPMGPGRPGQQRRFMARSRPVISSLPKGQQLNVFTSTRIVRYTSGVRHTGTVARARMCARIECSHALGIRSAIERHLQAWLAASVRGKTAGVSHLYAEISASVRFFFTEPSFKFSKNN